MPRLFFLFFLLAVVAPGRAAFELDGLTTSLPFAARGEFGGNPAALRSTPCFSWRVAHAVPFGLRELRYQQVGLGFPFKEIAAGFSFSSAGFELHREWRTRLALGFSPGRSFDLGVGLDLLALEQRGPAARRYLAPIAGVRLAPSRKVELGAWWQGATAVSDTRFFVKIVRRLDGQSAIYLHGRRSDRPARFDLAAERHLHERLDLRLGLRTKPRRFALGAGFGVERLRLDYGVVTHAFLGNSHTLALGNTCSSP